MTDEHRTPEQQRAAREMGRVRRQIERGIRAVPKMLHRLQNAATGNVDLTSAQLAALQLGLRVFAPVLAQAAGLLPGTPAQPKLPADDADAPIDIDHMQPAELQRALAAAGIDSGKLVQTVAAGRAEAQPAANIIDAEMRQPSNAS